MGTGTEKKTVYVYFSTNMIDLIDFYAARLNTVSYILAEEMGHRNLNPVHRLDKLTSGVLIFAKVG